MDYFPTICTLVGVNPPVDAAFDGVDMSPTFWGGGETRTKPLFWEYGRKAKAFPHPSIVADRSPNVAVREGDWKLLVHADGKGTELNKLALDPQETKNAALEPPGLARRLCDEALKWRRSLPVAPGSITSDSKDIKSAPNTEGH